MLDTALGLCALPHRGTVHDASRGIRKLNRQPYKIFYRVNEHRAGVEILHFWHAARSEPKF